jgi:hypothetical protein
MCNNSLISYVIPVQYQVECVDEFDPFFAFYTKEERQTAKEKLRELIQKKYTQHISFSIKQIHLSFNNILSNQLFYLWFLRIQKDGDNAVQEPPVIFTDLLPAFAPLRNFSLSFLLKFNYVHYYSILTVFQYVMKIDSINLQFFIILSLTFFIILLPHFFINVFI